MHRLHSHARAAGTGKRQRTAVCGSAAVWETRLPRSKRWRIFNAAGAEPLAIEQKEFAALFRGRKLTIKAALLNQTLFSGVGNIYEKKPISGGIRPRRFAGRLTRAELEHLAYLWSESWSRRSDGVDHRFQTTWTRRACAVFFSWNTAFILEPGSPAEVQKADSTDYSGRAGNSFLPEVAAMNSLSMVFRIIRLFGLPVCKKQADRLSKRLKLKENKTAHQLLLEIASDVPAAVQGKPRTAGPGKSNRQTSGP